MVVRRILRGLMCCGALLFFGASAFSGAGTGSPARNRPPEVEVVPGRIVVKLRAGDPSDAGLGKSAAAFHATPSLRSRLTAWQVGEVRALFPDRNDPLPSTAPDLSQIYELTFPLDQNPMEVASAFRDDPNVVYAEPRFVRHVYLTPNDSLFSHQSYLESIQAPAAWEIERGDTNVVIGIVDTGLDWHHPDLQGNLWHNPGEIPDNGLDDDNNGYVDDVLGWDLADADNDPMNKNADPVAAHGTRVAGIAAATPDNRIGIAGTGFRVRIMAVKTVPDLTQNPGRILFGFEAIKYAAENGADIINLSWGAPGWSDFEFDVIQYARSLGSLVVAAAGNTNNRTPHYPAAYPGVLAVTALESDDTKAPFASFGNWVDVAAPGVDMITTDRGGRYTFVTGSSFAAPLAAGVAALVKSHHPEWTSDQVREQVRVTATNIDAVNPAYQARLGSGKLHAVHALTQSSPAIRLVEVQLAEAEGDDDGVFEPGEKVSAIFTAENLLADARDIRFELFARPDVIRVEQGVVHMASLGPGERKTNSGDPFVFAIEPDTYRGLHVELTVRISTADGTYSDRDHFSATIAPLFRQHNVGNVVLTITSRGNLGFNDYPTNQEGRGFIFKDNGKNLLFEGAFLAGTNPVQVSDVARNGKFFPRDFDFVPVTGAELDAQTPGALADQQTSARFTDKGSRNPIGIEVHQETFGFAAPPNDDYVILKYTITNQTDKPIEDLYAGLFLDWDIDERRRETNLVDFDATLDLGYMYSTELGTHCGVTVLNGLGSASYRAIDNQSDLSGGNGFTDAQKYQFLNEGFKNVSLTEPGDYSHMISTGPFDMPPGEAVVAGFAVLAGESLEDLRANAAAARSTWKSLFGLNLAGNTPQAFALNPNYPNPFNPRTTIPFNLAEPSRVTLRVFNLLGQEVTTLVDETRPAGRYEIFWEGRDRYGRPVASGVYVIRMRAGDFAASRKLLLMR